METVAVTNTEVLSLFSHQQKAVAALNHYFRPELHRKKGMLVMPTGSGKTLTAAHWLLSEKVAKGERVLWLVHRIDLIDQAEAAFIRLANLLQDSSKQEFTIGKISGTHPKEDMPPQSDVTIASIFSLSQFPQGEKLTVVIDEAHHSVSKAYQTVIKRLEKSKQDFQLIGLTATPSRFVDQETAKLFELFDVPKHKLIHETNPKELMVSNILAIPKYVHVQTKLEGAQVFDLSETHILKLCKNLDPKQVLNKIAKHNGRNKLIVDHYVKYRNVYQKTIVFAINIRQAKMLETCFKKVGVTCVCCVSGDPMMAQNLKQFKDEPIEVLINVLMVCEGSDIPSVQTVFLTRPTKSKSLLIQMIGRALRGIHCGGTASAYIVDFQDQWEQIDCWLNPERVMEFYMGDTEMEKSPTKSSSKLPGIDDEAYETLYEAMNKCGSTKIIDRVIPIGWYEVADIKGKWHHLFVYEHDQEGYLRVEADASDLIDNQVTSEQVQQTYFSNMKQPSLEQLKLLTYHLHFSKKLPLFHRFREHQVLNGDAFIKLCHQESIIPRTLRFEHKLTQYFNSHPMLSTVYESIEPFWEAVMEKEVEIQ